MSGPKINPYRTPKFSRPASEKKCSCATKFFLFKRNDSDQLMTEYLRPMQFIFSGSTV